MKQTARVPAAGATRGQTRQPRSKEDPVDKVEQEVIAGVEEHGWYCMVVLPRGDEPEGFVPFAYTVGLWRTYEHPELIIVGAMRPEVLHGLLAVAAANVKGGRRYAVGERYDDIAQRFESQMGMVTPANREAFLTYADWFNGRRPFGAIQLLWTDPEGRFPGEPGYDESRFRQPLL